MKPKHKLVNEQNDVKVHLIFDIQLYPTFILKPLLRPLECLQRVLKPVHLFQFLVIKQQRTNFISRFLPADAIFSPCTSY